MTHFLAHSIGFVHLKGKTKELNLAPAVQLIDTLKAKIEQ